VEPPPGGSSEGIGVRPPSRTVPDLQLRLQAQPNSAQLLRQRLYLWLDELGANDDEFFDVALACTEAFANAVEHPNEPTADEIEVEGSIDGRTITLTVHDHGSWREQRQREEGGYGFPLMRHLMSRVEVHTQPDGTAIRMQRQLARPFRYH
jgi:anti-sigma regulatory factor (Ser/Thr protein kinase)